MQTLAEALVSNYNNHWGIIAANQLDHKIFEAWCAATIGIYKNVMIIKEDRSWVNLADIKQMPENSEIYAFVSEIFGMIGPVNDYPLRRENDLGGLFVAFVTAPLRAEEKEVITNGNKRTLFRLRFERYLARLIIEQSLKPRRLLEDEYEDLRSVRRVKSQRRKKALLEQENRADASPKVETENDNKLAFTSILVRCNTYSSHAHDSVQRVTAIVDIAMSSGSIIQEKAYLGYCSKCDVYLILEYDYKRLRSLGVLLCQVISSETYNKTSGIKADFLNLKPESLLHQSGYNVSFASNLSIAQRQEILNRVIVNKLYSPPEIVSFLDWLIKRNSNVSVKNMDLALSKWKADRQYVYQQYISSCK